MFPRGINHALDAGNCHLAVFLGDFPVAGQGGGEEAPGGLESVFGQQIGPFLVQGQLQVIAELQEIIRVGSIAQVSFVLHEAFHLRPARLQTEGIGDVEEVFVAVLVLEKIHHGEARVIFESRRLTLQLDGGGDFKHPAQFFLRHRAVEGGKRNDRLPGIVRRERVVFLEDGVEKEVLHGQCHGSLRLRGRRDHKLEIRRLAKFEEIAAGRAAQLRQDRDPGEVGHLALLELNVVHPDKRIEIGISRRPEEDRDKGILDAERNLIALPLICDRERRGRHSLDRTAVARACVQIQSRGLSLAALGPEAEGVFFVRCHRERKGGKRQRIFHGPQSQRTGARVCHLAVDDKIIIILQLLRVIGKNPETPVPKPGLKRGIENQIARRGVIRGAEQIGAPDVNAIGHDFRKIPARAVLLEVHKIRKLALICGIKDKPVSVHHELGTLLGKDGKLRPGIAREKGQGGSL